MRNSLFLTTDLTSKSLFNFKLKMEDFVASSLLQITTLILFTKLNVLYLSGVESAGTCRSPCSIAIVGYRYEVGRNLKRVWIEITGNIYPGVQLEIH